MTTRQAVKFGLPVLGFIYGSVVSLTFPDRTAPLWLVWMAFAIAASTAAGALCAYGLSRWRELKKLNEIYVHDVRRPVAALVVGSLVLMNVTVFFPGPSH